jgi:predicted  nucleic acid-binding Zn-ribbon protein
MDPQSVLLALEEQKKWTARRRRIEERMKTLDRRRDSLLRELERVRKKIGQFGALLTDLKEPHRKVEWSLPSTLIR